MVLLDSVPTLTSLNRGFRYRLMDVSTFDLVKSVSFPNLCSISGINRGGFVNFVDKCFQLTFLDLQFHARDAFDDIVMSSLVTLAQLSELHLTNCNISGACAKLFSRMERLIALSLDRVWLENEESELCLGRALSGTSLRNLEIASAGDGHLQMISVLLDENHPLQWVRVEMSGFILKLSSLFVALAGRCTRQSNPRSAYFRHDRIFHVG